MFNQVKVIVLNCYTYNWWNCGRR